MVPVLIEIHHFKSRPYGDRCLNIAGGVELIWSILHEEGEYATSLDDIHFEVNILRNNESNILVLGRGHRRAKERPAFPFSKRIMIKVYWTFIDEFCPKHDGNFVQRGEGAVVGQSRVEVVSADESVVSYLWVNLYHLDQGWRNQRPTPGKSAKPSYKSGPAPPEADTQAEIFSLNL